MWKVCCNQAKTINYILICADYFYQYSANVLWMIHEHEKVGLIDKSIVSLCQLEHDF